MSHLMTQLWVALELSHTGRSGLTTTTLLQVYFIGNAPMAHLNVCNSSSSSSAAGQTDVAHNAAAGSPGGSGDPHLGSNSSSSSGTGKAKPSDKPSAHTVFFHLAQVVNDPWEVFLEDQVAEEFAWVAKDELEQYIRDPQLLKLAHKML